MRSQSFIVRFLTLAASIVSISAHAATEVKYSGFAKASVIGSDRSASSFGYDNLAAPTAARPKGMTSGGAPVNDENGNVSFQTAQSRLNLQAEVDKTAKATFEFDFLDVTKSSPTTQMAPRVRIAKVDYRASDAWLITAGQDWDIFGPMNAYTYNYVGNNFLAGNLGFMRQQVIVTNTHDDFELKYALGLSQANATSSVGDAEHTNWPTLAVSGAWGKAGDRYGLSAIGGHLVLTTAGSVVGDNRTDRDVYGATAFAEKPLGNFAFRSEIYWGQNLANTGTLSISQATTAVSLKEYGGFFSGKYTLGENKDSSIFGTVGFAQIVNDGDVPAVAATLAAGAITAPIGMKGNFAAKLGYDTKLSERLTLFGEASRFETNYAGMGAAVTYVGEAGLLLLL